MIIESLTPTEFLTWINPGTVRLPPGLTLLMGDNGCGKSALGLELPTWLLWGETVRGTSPPGKAHGVFRAAGGGRWSVSRSWRKGGKQNGVSLLEWYSKDTMGDDGWPLGPKEDRTGQTATETQERIDRVFGSCRRFMATRVFSRRLLNRFGAATDRERKALLEEVLGLDRFERAYVWVRKERLRLTQEFEKAHAAEQAKRAALEQAEAALAGFGPTTADDAPEAIEARLVEVRRIRQGACEKAVALSKKSQALASAVQKFQERLAGIQAEEHVARGRLRALENPPATPKMCPACRRPFDQASAQAVAAHTADELAQARDAVAKLGKRRQALAGDGDNFRVQHATASGDSDRAAREVHEMDRQIAGLEPRLENARNRAAHMDRARAQLAAARAALADVAALASAADRACTVAEKACNVLGPKGARVKLMADALAQLEKGANAVLPRLGGKARAIKISGTRPKADGDEVAEVSIKVLGAGGGEYEGTSDGEQTRIDVALLLALASLTGDSGYVAFDEVFDPLDDAGLEGSAEVLAELARDRQVVVITHNKRFESLLPGAARLRAVAVDETTSRLEAA